MTKESKIVKLVPLLENIVTLELAAFAPKKYPLIALLETQQVAFCSKRKNSVTTQ